MDIGTLVALDYYLGKFKVRHTQHYVVHSMFEKDREVKEQICTDKQANLITRIPLMFLNSSLFLYVYYVLRSLHVSACFISLVCSYTL